jgi:PAS domain S-box-containing protein
MSDRERPNPPPPPPLEGNSVAWLAAIIDSSEDAILSKTLDGLITSWNPGAERIFGYTAEEAIGRHIMLIVPEDRWEEEQHVLARLRRGERLDHFETVRRTKDGRLIDISLTVSPIRNAEGRIVGASTVARDVTERRRYEVERRRLLAAEKEARSTAETLNRSKDQFLATLSHELRTPLNAIFGWARMLESGELDAETVKRANEAILRNAMAQVRLVEDLLDVSRVISGQMRLDVGPVDLKAVVEAALDAVRPAAAAKSIQLQTVLDPRAGPTIGAADRLQQVVWNLLINAVKFTPKGGRVQVHLQRVDSHVEIVVSDTGEGIAEDLLPHVFERFRQGEMGSNRRHGGLGIGLALVRHLIDLHGGTVGAESAGVGFGASFTVKLPVALGRVEPRPTEPQEKVAPEAGDATLVSLQGLKVLAVDDDLDGLELVQLILVAGGAEVRTRASVPEALAALDGWWPDVLIADIEMPHEDGFSLLRSARRAAAARGRRLPALALTAYGRPEDRVRVLTAGFNLHLAKPVDPNELRLSVGSLAGRIG